MQSAHPTGEDGPSLYYKEINGSSQSPTVLLIHGAFSSSTDWEPVIPHLSDAYHLLVPDLPGHGASEHIGPFSEEHSARLLARLISERALDGRAHVVGLSLGAHVAIELASKYPQVVNAVLVSGYEVFASSQLMAYGLWLQNRIQSAFPQALVRWLMDGTDIPSGKCSMALCHAVAKTGEWPPPWPGRTLIVAAGKSGILPTADHPHDAVRLRDIGRQANSDTKAYTHPQMRHPWSLQAPELFARTARDWVEHCSVPDGFVEL